MKTKMKTSSFVIIMAIAIVVAIYTLLPFLLVVINVFKNANGIVADPVGFTSASVGQLMTNLSNVVNNSNFSFWYASSEASLPAHLLQIPPQKFPALLHIPDRRLLTLHWYKPRHR